MSSWGNALPSNRTQLENALLRIEDEARLLIKNNPEHGYIGLSDALDKLDRTRDAIRRERLDNLEGK